MTVFPDIYFLPEWGKYFETKERGGGLSTFELKNELGHIFYQFIARPIPIEYGGETYFDTITPYGFSGPVVLDWHENRKEELIDLFEEKFQEYCMEHRIVAEYVRFNPWMNNSRDFQNIYKLRSHGTTLRIDLTVGDFFMEEFSSKARRQVRRARKNNVEIEFDYTGFSIKEFHRLYSLMAKKNQISEYYMFTEDFLKNSFEVMKGKQLIINAKHEGRYISSVFLLHHGDYLHYHLAATDPDYYHLAGNSLLMYEACRWGVENGKKEMHLGGAGGDENLYRFKKGFTRTEDLDLLMGMKIRNTEVYQNLVEQKRQQNSIQNESYFPLYRG